MSLYDNSINGYLTSSQYFDDITPLYLQSNQSSSSSFIPSSSPIQYIFLFQFLLFHLHPMSRWSLLSLEVTSIYSMLPMSFPVIDHSHIHPSPSLPPSSLTFALCSRYLPSAMNTMSIGVTSKKVIGEEGQLRMRAAINTQMDPFPPSLSLSSDGLTSDRVDECNGSSENNEYIHIHRSVFHCFPCC